MKITGDYSSAAPIVAAIAAARGDISSALATLNAQQVSAAIDCCALVVGKDQARLPAAVINHNGATIHCYSDRLIVYAGACYRYR